MSLPRRLLPKLTHAICRRTAGRRLFLKPTKAITELILYCLGVALIDPKSRDDPDGPRRRRVALHALQVNTNHYHLVMTDTSQPWELSELADFMGHFNSLVAKSLNARYGKGENFWCDGSYDNVEIHNQPSLEDQLTYVWTNVVKDGHVPHPDDWTGAQTTPDDFGRVLRAHKPKDAYFGSHGDERTIPTDPDAYTSWRQDLHDEQLAAVAAGRAEDAKRRAKKKRKGKKPAARGKAHQQDLDRKRANKALTNKLPQPLPKRERSKLPDTVEIPVAVPPGYEHWAIEDVRAYFTQLRDQRLKEIHEERKAEGKHSFRGLASILAVNPMEQSLSTWPSFARNPRIACKGDSNRYRELLEALQAWRQEYRDAYNARTKRGFPAAFPLGTYGLRRRFHHVKVRGANPPPDLAA